MTAPRVLIAGVGNIFRGDDGFGGAVIAALGAPNSDPLPAGVVARDYGIRGLDLAFELLDPPERLILVDAVSRGDQPGTLFLIQPTGLGPMQNPDPHGMDVTAVLASVRMLGGELPATPNVLILGCEPQVLDETMGLSPVVASAVEPAARWIRELVAREARSAGQTREETNHEMGQTY